MDAVFPCVCLRRDPRNEAHNRGYAFVGLASAEEATRAVRELHQRTLDGRGVTVDESKDYNKLFMRFVPYDVDAERLKAELVKIDGIVGVTKVELQPSPEQRGSHRGFGTVEFYNSACADQALRRLTRVTPLLFNQRMVHFEWCEKPRAEHQAHDPKVLYVTKLPNGCSEPMLRSIFEAYGPVAQIKLPMPKPPKTNRDFGFVFYEESESGRRCLDAVKDTPIVIEGQEIRVQAAKPLGRSAPPPRGSGHGGGGPGSFRRDGPPPRGDYRDGPPRDRYRDQGSYGGGGGGGGGYGRDRERAGGYDYPDRRGGDRGGPGPVRGGPSRGGPGPRGGGGYGERPPYRGEERDYDRGGGYSEGRGRYDSGRYDGPPPRRAYDDRGYGGWHTCLVLVETAALQVADVLALPFPAPGQRPICPCSIQEEATMVHMTRGGAEAAGEAVTASRPLLRSRRSPCTAPRPPSRRWRPSRPRCWSTRPPTHQRRTRAQRPRCSPPTSPRRPQGAGRSRTLPSRQPPWRTRHSPVPPPPTPSP